MFDSSVQSDSRELLEPLWMLTSTKQHPRVILLFPDGRKIYLQHNRYNTALHGKEYNIQRCEAVAFENPRSTECCITSQQVWLQDFWIRSSLGQLARSRDGTCPGLQAPWSDTSGRGAAAERRPLLSTALLYGTMETSSSRAALISRQRGAFLGYKLS